MIGSEHLIELTYLVATALFILALKWMSSPSTAKRGVRAGELGMLLAIGGHAASPWHRRLHLDCHRLSAWHDHRHTSGTGADDGCATANRAEPCVRRPVRHAGWHGRVLPQGSEVSRFMMAVLALEVILGSLTFTGSLMAAGKLQEILPQRPITYRARTLLTSASSHLPSGLPRTWSSIQARPGSSPRSW